MAEMTVDRLPSIVRYGTRRALDFAQGAAVATTFDAVVGADVATRLGYAPGQRIVLTPGPAIVTMTYSFMFGTLP